MKMDSPEISELTSELSSCRADDRNSNSQLTQYIVAAWTILIAAYALGQLTGISENAIFQLLLFSLTVFVLCALGAFIICTGVTGALRHHYMIYLEDRLTEVVSKYTNFKSDQSELLLHWTSLSKPIITLNIHNIKSKYSRHFFTSMVLSVISLVALALIFLGVQIFMFDFSKMNGGNIAIIIFLILMVVIMTTYGIYTFLISSQHSKDFFKYAKTVAIKQRLSRTVASQYKNTNAPESRKKNKNMQKLFQVALYFLYPRLRDVQKMIFIILGFMFGFLFITPAANVGIDFKLLGLTILITDVLVYQARFQWNDIRGMSGDSKDNLNRGIPKFISKKRYIPFVIISLLILMIKLYIAFYILIPCYGVHQYIFFNSNMAILLLAVLYEFSRSFKWGKTTMVLVGIGYAIRFVIGLLAANARLLADTNFISKFDDLKFSFENVAQWFTKLFSIGSIAKTPENIGTILLSVSASLAIFGITFVTLGWALTIASNQRIIKGKPHYTILSKSIRDINSTYPLMQSDNKLTWWNVSFFLSIAFLSFAQYKINSSVFSIGIAVIPVVCTILYSFYRFETKKNAKNKRNSISIFICICYFILVFIFVRISFREINAGHIYLFIAFIQIFYTSVYNAFRNMNYTELYNSLPLMFQKVGDFILRVIIGKDTLKMLRKK